MKTLVIIDDEPVIRGMLARHLELQGWRVLEAENGDRGLELITAHRPDAVLCDLLMPGTNGFKVCRTIRSRRAELGDITVIITTGSSFPADRKSALEAGANHYLLKPVSPRDVIAILENQRPLTDAEPAAPAPPAVPTNGADEVRIRFWGVRGSIASPGPATVRYGGNTSCVEVRCGGEIIVLDAGTGIRALGESLRKEFAGRPIKTTLLLSHTHWDHIQGLPFFRPAYDQGNSVTVLGYEGAQQSLLKTLSAQMDSAFFPVSLDRLTGSLTVRELKELEFQVGRIPVQATFTNHPGITLAYRLCTPCGGVVYMPDTEILPFPRSPSASSELKDPPASEEFSDYKNQLLAEFAQDADIFICDAQYTAADYESHRGWGHSCIDDTVAMAIRAKVKRLLLFHHDPTRDDAGVDEMVAHARALVEAQGANLRVDAAAEGLEILLTRKSRLLNRG